MFAKETLFRFLVCFLSSVNKDLRRKETSFLTHSLKLLLSINLKGKDLLCEIAMLLTSNSNDERVGIRRALEVFDLDFLF
mmetsp:Transcript_32940/g.48312  ORF Transcript_32940/g.48312 Transcript_32940/m.48312 type:complete len:80 (-) Transcript_32940:103-342(-)